MAKKSQKLKKAPHKPSHCTKQKSGKDISYFASPYNVQPVDSKDQSRKDKLKYLKANGITGKNALRLAKSNNKLSKGIRQKKVDGVSKPSNKGWRKKQVIKLPEHVPSAVPWSLSSPRESLSSEGHSIPSKKNQILPSAYYSLSQSTIASLQHELESFTDYIRLTPDEIAARNSVVEFITKLSHSLWHKEVDVQQFGSYATLDVCTFQSDIDLALWNVVKADEESAWEEKGEKGEYIFGERSGTVLSRSSLLRTMQNLKSDASKNSKRKEEWKKVLEEVDLENDMKTSRSHGTQGKDGEDLFFVIDRKGVSSEEKFTHEEDASDIKSSHSKATPNEVINFVIDREGVKQPGGDNYDCEGDNDVIYAKPSAKPNANDERIVLSGTSDDDDNVDKMDAFHRRKHANELGLSDFSMERDASVIDLCSSNDESVGNDVRGISSVAKVSKPSSLNQFSSDSPRCCGEDEDADDSRFDLNISNHTNFGSSSAGIERKTIGPTGKVRTKVVKALSLLGKRLWKSSFAQNIQVRKNARVPIICMTTRFGFDSDVALGGHNGIDTSHYVRKVVEKYDSFATVVLFLKILLQQVDLDKPFTGGLGSYRLYVLVANHFDAHKSLGGKDSPAEMLVGFLYRYSTPSKSRSKARTQLKKEILIRSDGGEADLSAVSLDLCIELFQLCFQKLMDRLENHEETKQRRSLLASLIDVGKVKRERSAALNQAKLFSPPPQTRKHQSSHSNGTFSFTKSGSSKRAESNPESKSKNKKSAKKNYSPNLKQGRSARGALIPKRRPDVEMRLDGMDELMQRGAKNRKTKKKQKRDSAITEFVMRTVS